MISFHSTYSVVDTMFRVDSRLAWTHIVENLICAAFLHKLETF